MNIKHYLKRVYYGFLYMRIHKSLAGMIKVKTMDATIDELIDSEKSIIRFGDGELTLIKGDGISLQNSSKDIQIGLKNIINIDNENLLIAIPDIFFDLSSYRKESVGFWKEHICNCYKVYNDIAKNKEYYNAFISRFYYIYHDKKLCGSWIEKIKRIWKDKDIVIVEGSKTHNGVGNDLFDNARSVRRIIGPPQNAYSKVKDIVDVCLKFDRDCLFLLSMGIAAKFIAEELFSKGYRVIDIGNLDMEYEWFLRKSDDKEELLKNSIQGYEANINAGYTEYLSQIKYQI